MFPYANDQLVFQIMLIAFMAAIYFAISLIGHIIFAIPDESREAVGIILLLTFLMLLSAAFTVASIDRENGSGRVSVPFNIPIELVLRPFSKTTFREVWNTGCFNPHSVIVWLNCFAILCLFRAAPVASIVMSPWIAYRAVQVFDRRPESRGSIVGIASMFCLICGAATLSVAGVLVLPAGLAST